MSRIYTFQMCQLCEDAPLPAEDGASDRKKPPQQQNLEPSQEILFYDRPYGAFKPDVALNANESLKSHCCSDNYWGTTYQQDVPHFGGVVRDT